MEKYGFYVIKEEFFERFDDPYLKGNKDENRPHYYCFKDDTDGLYWVIPMSSRTEKYKAVIRHKQALHKPCDILHVCKLSNDKENAFLIQDMFPVTDEYIKRPYTFADNPLFLVNESNRAAINAKALRILNLISRGVQFNKFQPDVMKIKKELTDDLKKDRNITEQPMTV